MSGAALTVHLAQSRHGSPEPRVTVRMPRGSSHRATRAELYSLAAKIELASSGADAWCVVVGDGEVHLELVRCTPAEIARAMATLETAASATA